MWSLHCTSNNEVFYMLNNATYRVGKEYVVDVHNQKTEVGVGPVVRNTRGVCDSSISRSHAIFQLNMTSAHLENPAVLPTVELTDTDSKYGTYLNTSIENGVAMNKSHAFLLRHGYRVRFGKQWNIWRLQYRPLVVLVVNMEGDPRSLKVRDNVLKLGGHVVTSWSSKVTHVTMPSIKMTVKVVCALAKGIPIVTPDLWVTWVKIIEGQGHRVPARPLTLPDPAHFLPRVKDVTLNGYQVSFAVNPQRRTLFAGKTFVFVSGKQLLRMSMAIAEAGGSSVLFGRGGLTMEEMCEDNVIVVNNNVNVNKADTQLPDQLNTLMDILELKDKRVVPESEITLAVLYNSTETNCNPDFIPASLMRERRETQREREASEVLAPDTCDDQEVKPSLAPAPDTQCVAETLTTEEENPFSGEGTSRDNLGPSGSCTEKSSPAKSSTGHQAAKVKVTDSAEVTPGPSRQSDTDDAPQASTSSAAAREAEADVDMENLSVTSSVLTFRVDDPPCTLPRSLKTRRADDAPLPASKHARLDMSSDSEDDSQEVVVHRRPSVHTTAQARQDSSDEETREDAFVDLRDKAKAASDDDEDLFGFEDTDDIANILQRNKKTEAAGKPCDKKETSVPSGQGSSKQSRKRPNTQDERESFVFKTIKLPCTNQQAADQVPKVAECKQAKAGPSTEVRLTLRQVSLTQEGDEGWVQAEHFPPVKLEDGTYIEAPVVTCDTLIKPKDNVSVAVSPAPELSAASNVKPFRKSWHPINTGLPNIISMSELQGIQCRSGEVGPDANLTAEIEERERQRRMRWDFKDTAISKPAAIFRRCIK